MNLDDTICYCFHVSKRKILNFIRVNRPSRASQVSECGGAGTGCGWCRTYLRRYFEQSQTSEVRGADEPTAQNYAAGRDAYIAAGRGVPPGGRP